MNLGSEEEHKQRKSLLNLDVNPNNFRKIHWNLSVIIMIYKCLWSPQCLWEVCDLLLSHLLSASLLSYCVFFLLWLHLLLSGSLCSSSCNVLHYLVYNNCFWQDPKSARVKLAFEIHRSRLVVFDQKLHSKRECAYLWAILLVLFVYTTLCFPLRYHRCGLRFNIVMWIYFTSYRLRIIILWYQKCFLRLKIVQVNEQMDLLLYYLIQ